MQIQARLNTINEMGFEDAILLNVMSEDIWQLLAARKERESFL